MRCPSPSLLPFALLCAACETAGEPLPSPRVRVVVDAEIPRGHPEGPGFAPGGALVTASGAAGPVTFAVESLSATHLVATSATRLVGNRPVTWRIRTALATARGDTVWRAVDDVLLRPDGPLETLRPLLVRAGPDALLTSVEAIPAEAAVAVGDTVRIRGVARDPAGLFLLDATFGWRSRAPAVATVDGAGVVTGVAAGAAWVVARGWNGAADSARVRVVAP